MYATNQAGQINHGGGGGGGGGGAAAKDFVPLTASVTLSAAVIARIGEARLEAGGRMVSTA